MLKGATDVICNFMKESNHHAYSSPKDEDSPNKLTTHEVISQQSRLSSSVDKPENRKKNCGFNEQSSMKQQSTARILSKDSKQQGYRCDPLGHFCEASRDERKLLFRNEKNMKVVKSSETMRQTSICGFQGIIIPSVVGSVVGSSRSLASGDNLANQDEKEGEAVNNFYKDVDNLVEHIQSHISALRLCSKLADGTKGAVQQGLANMPTSVCPIVQGKEHLIKKNELSQAFEPLSDRDELLLSRLECQRIGKKDDSNGSHRVLDQGENDLLDDMMSQRRRIQHNEIGQTCKHIVRSNSRLNKKVGNRNVIGMVEAGSHKQSQTTGCYVHGLRVPINQDDITKRPPVPEKTPYAIPISNGGKESTPIIAKLRPPIPSQSAGSKASVRPITDKKILAYQTLPGQKGRTRILRNKILHHQQESEESTTSGTGSSDSEAYSLLSKDSAASISRRFARGVYEENCSSTSSDYRDFGESGGLYPTKTHKPIRPTISESEKAEVQMLGRLRRFKNKLGLIFHHHHHHHHHHHGNDQDDSRGCQTKSTWKPLRNLFHHRNRHEVHDKLRKARVSNVPVKHQAGHFHALVEGLMQHLRNPRKSKPSKGRIGWLGNDQHGHRNRKVKKLHWWQMFMRQGGVKLSNRRRVKIGFMSKKQQLKPPKFR
ncbi:uncharacterized protein LOC111300616 [Durio zibethinus]|uniref:Uncharacterized protein LOC111300616 n=1 Tax=Durio zibethinus TaxID=66656 RepID=A0A6P5ZHZ0_DURZI|nr:uncharacterized protein LOC111300616 [Durio zibethinus]